MKRPQSRDQELFVRGKKHEQDINEQTKVQAENER